VLVICEWYVCCNRNLLFLKDYDGDVSDLGLDFTVANNDFGEAQVTR